MSQGFKVTYATLSADNAELHAQLDAGIAAVRAELGRSYPFYVAGEPRTSAQSIESRSPADQEVVVGRVSSASAKDVGEAVAAAKAAWPAWRRTPWEKRCEIVERAAALVRERRFELTGWLILENGKNRVEALGEIEETADLYDYYAKQMRDHRGFIREMDKLSPADANTSVLRPYGVWAVVAPFNFPYALLGAPIAAALLAGNTVVGKPSSETPISGIKIAEAFFDAGLPRGVLSLIVGSGRVAGDALVQHPDVAGVTFTGSYDVGFHRLYKTFASQYPKPCIVEMGGKNPAIVMDSADLERAAMGVHRSAFGMGGQKCSACSRLYVHESVADELLGRIVKLAGDAKIGDPAEKGVFLGPVGTRGGYEDFRRYAESARRDGSVLAGGNVLTDGAMARGFFVEPTLVEIRRDHELFVNELFVPLLTVARVRSLDEALGLANDTAFGLTAGFFSRKDDEVGEFLDRIEAGVVYVNRAAGATTGAWPGVQPFGGWKGSGSTGKNIGGLYSVQCYLREQSRTVTS